MANQSAGNIDALLEAQKVYPPVREIAAQDAVIQDWDAL